MALLLAVLLFAGLTSIAAADHNTVELISTGPAGENGEFHATFGDVTSDGSKVFFHTQEALVSADDDDDLYDVYERSGAGIRLLSGPTASDGTGGALFGGASADGDRVFFHTDDSLLPQDADDYFDVYERVGDTVNLISQGNGNFDAIFVAASKDGTKVFFQTDERLVTGDTDALWDLYESSGSTTTRITVGAATEFEPCSIDFAVLATCAFTSDDGSRVIINTDKKLLVADTDAERDVYEYSNGSLSLVSIGNAPVPARFLNLSSDGGKVFFTTLEALTNDDTDSCANPAPAPTGCEDVYVRDLSGAVPTTTLVSTGPNEPDADYDAFFGGITPDGASAYFSTDASLVAGDSELVRHEDVYERSGITTTLISVGPVVDTADGDADFLAVSDDGNRVFFRTDERLVTEDMGTGEDIYERSGNQTSLISTGPTDVGQDDEDVCYFVPDCDFMISPDGGRVFFHTGARLTSGDTDSENDVYERASGQTTLVSAGGNGSYPAVLQGISSSGASVYFHTEEAISPADTDGNWQDIYQARFVQPAVAPPGTGTGTGTPPTTSSGKPNLTVKASATKTQRILRQGGVVVSFICNNACQGSATGSINVPGASKVFRLGKATKSAKSNKKTTLKLKLAKKARSAIKRALKRGKKLRAKVKLTVKDGSSTRTRSLTVRLKR